MYCFSQICRICLKTYTSQFINLNEFDNDHIKIHEKLKFCVPEIITDDKKLPEYVCCDCRLFLQQAYKFKRMCIKNSNILYKYVHKLSGGYSSKHHYQLDLVVAMSELNDDKSEGNQSYDNKSDSDKQSLGGISMFSVSLNQWDLFETKYTCRCVKEYNSFTENTSHLCRNCEGELHGFRLSKLKVGIAENRYKNIGPSQLESDDNSSLVSFDVTSERTDRKYEKGFDYNDFLLSRVHVNEVKKQIGILNSHQGDSDDDDSCSEEKPELDTHKSTTINSKTFECPICHKYFTRKYNLFNHYRRHEEGIIYCCDKCTNRYIDQEEYNNHLKTHETELTSKSSKSNKSLPQPHKESSEKENETKNLSFDEDKSDLNQTMNSSTESLTCSTCDKIFEHKSHLAIHLLTHVGKKEFKCSNCGEEFFRKENLLAHQTVHKKQRKYKCNQCDKSYNHASNIKRHRAFAHGGKYSCSVCNAKFSEKSVLVDHIFNTHTKASNSKSPKHKEKTKDEDQSQNESESESPPTKKIKLKDINSSEKKKKYSCKTCSKMFSNKKDLRSHETSHVKKKITSMIVEENGKQGRMCMICKQVFSIKTTMSRHLRTHTKEKTKVCKLCKAQFVNLFSLQQHLRTHELKYNCKFCKKSYLTKASMSRHIDREHMK